MANSPSPERPPNGPPPKGPPEPPEPFGPQPPEPLPERPDTFPWFWLGTVVGSVMSAVGFGVAFWGWNYLQEDLSPQLSDALTNYLERPVELGEVENVTLGRIQLGPSSIGASQFDPTTVTAETVFVEFDLFDTLLNSKLDLDLVVQSADGTLIQDEEKGWLNFYIPDRQSRDNRFEISLNEVAVQDSELTLVPLPLEGQTPEPIDFDNVSGQLNIAKVSTPPEVAERNARQFRFDISGMPLQGGEITLKGEVDPVSIANEAEPSADRDGSGDVASETAPVDAEPPIEFATNLFITAAEAPLSDVTQFTLSSIKAQTDRLAIDSGTVSGSMQMAFRPDEDIDYSGNIRVADADVLTELLPLPAESVSGEAQFDGVDWDIERLEGRYGAIALEADGKLNFETGYDLEATARDVTVDQFVRTVDLTLPVPTEGQFDVAATMQGELDDPTFTGTVSANELLTVDRLTFSDAIADFFVTGNQLFLSDIAAQPTTGGTLLGSGQVLLGQGSPFSFEIAGRNLPADAIGALYGLDSNFEIGAISADATVAGNSGGVSTTVRWDAPNSLYPGQGTIDIAGDTYVFRDTTFAIGGGQVRGSGTLVGQLWDSNVTFDSVELSTFSPDLKGDVNGQFQFNGSTADTSVGAIAASGNLQLSDGLSSFNAQLAEFDDPLTAQVAWNGAQIQILQASTDRLTAQGTLTPTFDRGFTGLERLDLDITGENYTLAELPIPIPDILRVNANTQFAGRLSGAPTSPSFDGNVQLANLIVNALPFQSPLSGPVSYSPGGGTTLNLAGGGDRIQLAVGPVTPGEIPSLDFDIGWQDAIARGQTQGDILTGEAQNFPLAALNFPLNGVAGIGQVRGTLTVPDFTANLSTQTLEGTLAVNQLGIGYIGAGQILGRVSYADSVARLTNAKLILNDDLYTVNGQLALTAGAPTYSADITTDNGNVQSLLSALSIYRLSDFQRGLTPPEWLEDPLTAAEIDRLFTTISVGLTETGQPLPLDQRLDRLAEIQRLQQEGAIAEEERALPPLRDLEGPFAGIIQLDGQGSDFELDFDLAGNNWQWGENYSAQTVVARGSLTPNVVTLEPVRFTSTRTLSEAVGNLLAEETVNEDMPAPELPSLDAPDAETVEIPTIPVGPIANDSGLDPDAETIEAEVNLAGQFVFGRNTELTSDLQATANSINVAALRDILEVPLNIQGLASGRATLSGTLDNPQLRGGAQLSLAAINNAPIQQAAAQFLYRDAELFIQSALTADTPEQPLRLTAQIPYAFNFMETQPESDVINVDVSVQNEGLALLNIFSEQVAWESGQGAVNLNVSGTLADPEISGTANISDAVIQAKVLPEPLTNVAGDATFVGDRIIVNSLQGQFSDGQLTAAGIFPLSSPVISGGELAALTRPVVNVEGSPGGPLYPQPLQSDRPLTVNLQNIDLSLEDLYNGGVDGQVIVGGSALGIGPQVSGQVLLSNGEVLLPETGGTSSAATFDEAGNEINPSADPELDVDSDLSDHRFGNRVANKQRSSRDLDSGENSLTPIFRDLRLTLGEDIRIVQGNLLNFVADGSLLLNGPATELAPEGTINIRSGRVNLFTTLFRLRGNDNIAVFTPEEGLQNPFLDVSLRASVSEVDRNFQVAASPFAQADVIDTSGFGFDNSGSLQTIRVRADVEGPANAIFDNLELSSSPNRSEDELLALIGGGFVTALESTLNVFSGGGSSVEGLVNLVGAPLLNNIEGFVGNAASISDFRLFPVTTATRNEEGEDDGGVDIGAEIGFNLSEDTSLSVQKILTDDTRAEFGLNYRLTDSLNLRANTNFEDINQVLLEYEIRF